ncbi:hypothetical protein [Undibacterium sp. Ji22W]|uniref:hypothetical protein n=1 Tax=Undibacterium sp. Ji22W TaxID=3413038 RepID=UPI003BEF822C
MKSRHKLFCIFCALGLVACTKKIEATTIVQISVSPTNYVVRSIKYRPDSRLEKSEEVTYQTNLELKNALKDFDDSTNMMLIPTQDAQQKRIDEVLEIVKNSGFNGKVGMVGNEVFN